MDSLCEICGQPATQEVCDGNELPPIDNFFRCEMRKGTTRSRCDDHPDESKMYRLNGEIETTHGGQVVGRWK